MSLPYLETASSVAGTLGLLVPIFLGIIRGLFPKSGWMLLFAAMSGLAGWCSLQFSILANMWNQSLLNGQEMSGLGSNGAANAFASIFGWFPGVVLFFGTLAVTVTVFRWLPNKLRKANKPWDVTGDSVSR